MKQQKFFGIILVICVLVTLTGCASATTFDGSRVKNADSYQLDIKTMNCTDTHTLELEQGDTTTVYKLADGTYMDRIERHFSYNGTDTWTDEDGVEWNEVVK